MFQSLHQKSILTCRKSCLVITGRISQEFSGIDWVVNPSCNIHSEEQHAKKINWNLDQFLVKHVIKSGSVTQPGGGLLDQELGCMTHPHEWELLSPPMMSLRYVGFYERKTVGGNSDFCRLETLSQPDTIVQCTRRLTPWRTVNKDTQQSRESEMTVAGFRRRKLPKYFDLFLQQTFRTFLSINTLYKKRNAHLMLGCDYIQIFTQTKIYILLNSLVCVLWPVAHEPVPAWGSGTRSEHARNTLGTGYGYVQIPSLIANY